MKPETMLKIVLGSALLWEAATHPQKAELHLVEETFASEALNVYEMSPPSGVQQTEKQSVVNIPSYLRAERVEGLLFCQR